MGQAFSNHDVFAEHTLVRMQLRIRTQTSIAMDRFRYYSITFMLAVAACCSIVACVAHACDSPQFVAPQRLSTQTSQMVLLSWKPVASASRYEVTLDARAAEGEVVHRLARSMAATSTEWDTRALALRRITAVSVSIHTICALETVSLPVELIFFIEPTNHCPPLSGLSVTSSHQSTHLRWDRSQGDPPAEDHVEARLYFGSNASSVIGERVPSGAIAFSLQLPVRWTLAARRLCGNSHSDWRWIDAN
jgi:hypothetical protein